MMKFDFASDLDESEEEGDEQDSNFDSDESSDSESSESNGFSLGQNQTAFACFALFFRSCHLSNKCEFSLNLLLEVAFVSLPQT